MNRTEIEVQGTYGATEAAPNRAYSPSVGYLRAFLTLLVVIHHAILAYHPYAPPPPASLVAEPRWWQAFPIVDSQRWTGFSLVTGFNDIFFMSLMFFVSGLFVWDSLQRKGTGRFLRDRLVRLGVPFALAAAFFAPAAYYPAYLQSHASDGFWHEWLALGNWPAGPAWFLWVLLAFDCVAALLTIVMPRWGTDLGRLVGRAGQRPVVFFASLVAVSAAAYIPLATVFPAQWSAFGPFTFQTARIFHYLAYFLIAVGVGAAGLPSGLLAAGGRLARRWGLWTGAAVLAFGVATGFYIVLVTAHPTSASWAAANGLGFTLSCAASSFALLAIFVRFARSRVRLLDSLSENAYGIYLIHYAVVSWLQWSLLGAQLPGIAKGLVVCMGAIAISWVATVGLRRIPGIAKII